MEHLTPGSGSHVSLDRTKFRRWTVYVTDADPDLKIFAYKRDGVYTWNDNKLQVTATFNAAIYSTQMVTVCCTIRLENIFFVTVANLFVMIK